MEKNSRCGRHGAEKPGRLGANAAPPADRTGGPIASEILMARFFRSETTGLHTNNYGKRGWKFAKIFWLELKRQACPAKRHVG
jgi:hypothetical protein